MLIEVASDGCSDGAGGFDSDVKSATAQFVSEFWRFAGRSWFAAGDNDVTRVEQTLPFLKMRREVRSWPSGFQEV